jgi:hypothetical protein
VLALGLRVEGRGEVQKRLEEELERMKRGLNVSYSLRVRWIPCDESKLAGEVKRGVIYLYDEEEERAVETLKHEFIDHHLTREIVRPLVEYINVQKSLIESLIYKRKEDVVDKIAELL